MSVIALPVSEAKQRFTEIVKGVEEYFDRYLVTKNGKEAAVVMSAEEYESLLETLDVLASKKEVRAIREASAQARRGQTISLATYLQQKQRSPKRKVRC
jgi:prevent-host-death family protein